ncbi:Abi family protein [Limosilactobacillus reuteri]|uniref:Abi family protein n=1 Tax=Limosilactobacillus reuteri TaxID=1598 RepID=A0A347TAK8_LIMRT|nr:Abi family protein [Limosilactobacillus reuteri]AXX74957.1 Abi family protein [Limosilactobacillus reuteri]MRG69137.1 Abi family protein [Limosilactobacillus reuteri]WLR79375.1 Abi family protein [Limosilactobacillus reuteri]
MCTFKTINEQIDILKHRGLNIHNEERAKRYLLTNNYYNIINGYSKFFQDHEDHFVDGATFDEIRELYWFDKEFKQVLLNGILNAEHHLKSIAAYRFAEANPRSKYPYLQIENYDSNSLNRNWKLISRLSKILSSNCNYDNNTIYHNIHSHNDVPIWVIVDYFDFGTLRDFIRCLPRNVQNKIALDCIDFINDNTPNFNGTFPIDVMNSFIKNIHETRNVCAHNNRLLKFECRSDSVYFEPLHSVYTISSNRNNPRKDVFTTFISLQCFLSETEYSVLNNTLRKRVKHLNHRLHSISVNNILSSLGFPDNWHEIDPLPQS